MTAPGRQRVGHGSATAAHAQERMIIFRVAYSGGLLNRKAHLLQCG